MGVHPKVAQVRAGHSSVSVTLDIYSHAAESLQKAAAEQLDNAFQKIQKNSGAISVPKALSGKKGKVVSL